MWYYAQNGQQQGPISDEELKARLNQGLLKPDDQVWKEGMAAWTPAKQIKELFPVVPPTPPQLPKSGPPTLPQVQQVAQVGPPTISAVKSDVIAKLRSNPNVVKMLDPTNRMLMGFRLGLAIALFSVILPWVSGNASGSIGGSSFSDSASILGISSIWGIIAAAAAIAGLVFSFRKPLKLIQNNAQFSMAAFGALVVLVAFGAMLFLDFGNAKTGSYSDSFGNRASASVGASFGVYQAVISGMVASFCGLKNNWEPHTEDVSA